MGIKTAGIAVNYILPEEYGNNAFFHNRRAQQQKYLQKIQEKFNAPLMLIPLLNEEPEGIKELISLGEKIFAGQSPPVSE